MATNSVIFLSFACLIQSHKENMLSKDFWMSKLNKLSEDLLKRAQEEGKNTECFFSALWIALSPWNALYILCHLKLKGRRTYKGAIISPCQLFIKIIFYSII